MRQFMRSAIRGVARAGWANFLFLAVLILTMPANAQTGAAISGQAITPGGTPASNAQIRICPYTATGTPCSPLASIYSDPGLTVSITQPYSADQYGNYTFWVAPNETYIIQVQVNQTIYYSYYQTIGQGGVTAGVNSAQGTYPIQVNGESSVPATGNITISCATGQCGASSLGNLITPPSSGQYVILPPTGFTPVNSTASCPSTPQGYVIPDTAGAYTSMFAQAGPCGNNVNPDTWGGTFSWAGALESVGLTQSQVTAVYSAEIVSSSAFSGGGIPNQNQLDSACQSDTYFYTLTSGQELEADTGFVNFVAQQGTTGNMGTGTGVDSLTCTSKVTHQVANDGGAITMTVSSPVMIVYYTGTPVTNSTPSINFAAPLYWNSALDVVGLQIPFNYGLDSGSANSYQVSIPTLLVPGQTQYIPAVGTQIVITPANTNTAASTLTINGYGVVAITKASAGSQVALSGGEIVAGVDAILVFNGTSWQLINSQTGSGISYPSGTGIAQVTSGDNWGTTLTPSTLGGFLSGQTGCSTTAYAWVPADERCEALGSGSVGGSGTTGYVPLWTASTTLSNSHLNDGVTTANTITSTEPFAVNAPSQPSQVAITYDSNAVVPGSSTTVVFGANSSGQGVMSEAGGTAARICDASNYSSVCPGSGTPYPSGTGIPQVSSGSSWSTTLTPSTLGGFLSGQTGCTTTAYAWVPEDEKCEALGSSGVNSPQYRLAIQGASSNTALNKFACWATNSNDGNYAILCPAATYGTDNPPSFIGAGYGNMGTSGLGEFVYQGDIDIVCDDQVYQGDWVRLSTSTAGECDDPQESQQEQQVNENPEGNWIVGYADTSNTGAGTQAEINVMATYGYAQDWTGLPTGSGFALTTFGSTSLSTSYWGQCAVAGGTYCDARALLGRAPLNIEDNANAEGRFKIDNGSEGVGASSNDIVFDNQYTSYPYTGSSGVSTALRANLWSIPYAATVSGSPTALSIDGYDSGHTNLLSNTIHYTLSGNLTVPAPVNDNAGDILTWVITQAASGGPYTVTWPANFENFPTVTTTAGATTVNDSFYDGVDYWCLSNCAGTGTGNVSDGSGTSTANEVALSTSTTHTITYSTALPNGTTATTQTTGDSSTKVATDAFVLANAGAGLVLENGGSSVGTISTLNCSTGTSCSASSGVGTITATGGGSGSYINIGGSVTWTGCTYSSGVCTVSGSSTSTVTISGIPSGYIDLYPVFYGTTSTNANINITLNSDTSADYVINGSYQTSTNAPASSASASQDYCQIIGTTSTGVDNSLMFIPFYTNTTFAKAIENHAGQMGSVSSLSSNYDTLHSCMWNPATQAAITSITFTLSSGDYTSGTMFTIHATQ